MKRMGWADIHDESSPPRVAFAREVARQAVGGPRHQAVRSAPGDHDELEIACQMASRWQSNHSL